MSVFQHPNLFSLSGAFLSLALFYLLYEWRFGKETFWQANRIYLLLTPLLAWLIPHVHIVLTADTMHDSGIDPDLFLLLHQWQETATSDTSYPRLGEIILGIYLSGVVLSLGRLVLRSIQILRLTREGSRKECGEWTYVVHEKLPGPASFFRFIFSSSPQPLPEMILEHELVHVRQRHSLDLLLMECWVALHWYNPLIYRLRHRLRATHEYIADAAVIQHTRQEAYDYAQLLIQQPLNQSNMLYNTFAVQINARLRMLARRPSASWRIVAHVMSLPLGLALLLFFSVQFAGASSLAQAAANLEAIEIPTAVLPEAFVAAAIPDTVPPAAKTVVIIKQNNQTDTIEASTTPKSTMDQALIVLDGVVQPGNSQEVLKSIKPEDIVSMSVWKGEKAIEKYGEKGKSGVIEISTRKGEKSESDSRTITVTGFALSPEEVAKAEKVEKKEITTVRIVEGKKINGAQKETTTETTTVTYAGDAGAPASGATNVNVEVEAIGKPGTKSSTNIRITSKGELVGEVKNANLKEFSGDQVIIDEMKGAKMEKPGKKAPATIRTITLDFESRERAEEALKSLKKNK